MKTLWIILFLASALIICINIAAYIYSIKYHKKQIEHLENFLLKAKHKQINLNQQLKVLRFSENYQKSNLKALYIIMNEVAETFFRCDINNINNE